MSQLAKYVLAGLCAGAFLAVSACTALGTQQVRAGDTEGWVVGLGQESPSAFYAVVNAEFEPEFRKIVEARALAREDEVPKTSLSERRNLAVGDTLYAIEVYASGKILLRGQHLVGGFIQDAERQRILAQVAD